MFINHNGEIYPADQPVLTVGNRGFKYGDGLFESMRVVKGQLKFAELHAERLQRGMKTLKMDGHSSFDAYFLKERAEELMRRNKTGANARIRVTVFREGEGLYSPTANKSGYVIETVKLDESVYKDNPKGLIVDVFEDVVKPTNSLSNYKTCNSLVYVMAGIFKIQNKLDEVMILNHNNLLCEAMSSNVFVVHDKQLYTPALSEGCIGGVMRTVVMRLAKENNIPVTEAQINPAILEVAEEIFLTNAARGIQWVMGYGRKRYFNEMSKFLLGKLNKT
ncbi:MAG: 4-amino-4-deoxychorismate lyase [Sphingobacteriaceae bacterium]|jgi:branched-chain amino acid aminotransferase|nr:4-amino-4-deoxychorismate lyase [Sphingobacteriaceae bacterium]